MKITITESQLRDIIQESLSEIVGMDRSLSVGKGMVRGYRKKTAAEKRAEEQKKLAAQQSEANSDKNFNMAQKQLTKKFGKAVSLQYFHGILLIGIECVQEESAEKRKIAEEILKNCGYFTTLNTFANGKIRIEAKKR